MSERGSGPIRVLCIFEDRAYEQVVKPLIERIATEAGLRVDVVMRFTRGCRFEPLEQWLKESRDAYRLCCIGADAGNLPAGKKERSMRKKLGGLVDDPSIVFAIAQPSAEAWLQADLSALKAGVATVTEATVNLPKKTRKYPRDEEGAKRGLRELLASAGVRTLQDGLEFGPAIMECVDVDAHPSIRRFVDELRGALLRA
ncbi:MAG: hypothetical protein ACRELB_11910 [Polyangiaceae bacterium]